MNAALTTSWENFQPDAEQSTAGTLNEVRSWRCFTSCMMIALSAEIPVTTFGANNCEIVPELLVVDFGHRAHPSQPADTLM